MKSIRYFLLVFILLFSGCNQPPLVFESPGSVDLRSQLTAGKTIQLDGLYRFYPGVFLSQTPEAKDYIAAPVPGPWDLYSLPGNRRMGPTGFGTFEIKVKVPKDKDRLALDVSDIGTAYRLYINGELVGEKGKAATDPAQHRPEVGQEIYHFISEGPLLDIRLEVSNFSYRKGGIWNPITIGPASDIVRNDSLDRSIQILLIGILLIMGLYHSGFFLIRKQETSLFFFGVACFLIAVRELTLGPRLLPLLVPYFSWAAYLRLEYICFFLALPTFAYYLWALFPGYFSIMAARFFLFCGVVSTVFVCSSQPLLFSSIIPYFQILSLVFILYGLGAAIRAALHGHSGARTILISGGIMGLAVIHDAMLLHYVMEGQRMVALGQIQFVVAQAFMLALRLSRDMKRIEAYNKTIEQRNDNLQQQKSTLEIRAAYDDLTGLGNRTLLMDSLQQQIQDFPDSPFSLLLMDLDNFRKVNDTAGHVVGDTILVEVARRLKYAMPDRDQLFRLEGDEFAIIHRNVTSQQEVRQYTGRLRSVFDQSFDIGETSFRTTASFGIAHYPDHGQTPLMLYRSADSAVILAKSSGKNREMEFDSEQDTEHRIRLDLSERLEQAIRKSELELYFQPIVDLRSRQTVGAEALLRWKEPELGFVAPDVFIPIAEETGQIQEIGRLVLAQALEALSNWNQVAPAFSVSVNVSPSELGRPGLISDVSALLAQYQVDPANLKMEITETMLMEDKNISLLHSLRELGVRLVMDDFGTGYSSFAYLQKFLFDILKIDKSFVLRLDTDDTVQPLVQAMIQMAHSLRMQVVAEGIETEETAAFLSNESCEMGQGYLYDPALPKDEFTARYLRPFRTSTV